MASYPKNYPFYNWVPKPIGIIILIFLFIPILTIGGVYSVNSGEMMSGLGLQSEHIQFVSFVTSVGMASFAPFFYRLVCIRREKMMCIAGFSIMYVLSYVCAKTDSVFLLALCSVVMGFLRMVLMMVNLFTLILYGFGVEATRNITPGMEPTTNEKWDALDTEKSVSQPAIYLFFMILGQIGTSLTAWLAYAYEWQYVYYCMMGTTLLSILVIFITMPYHNYVGRRFPINFSQFGNVVVFCIPFICFIYIMVYGKVLDWYDDPSIVRATIIGLVFTAIFFYLESQHRSPYFVLGVLKLRTVRMGIVLFILLMTLNTSSMFVNIYAGVAMKIDNWQNAVLGNWCIAGYFIGAVISMILGSKGVHLKYLFFIGFLILAGSAAWMYFEVQTMGQYERMKIPVIIRATGMMIIYALTAVHANQRMPFKYLSSWIAIMLSVRMVVGPGIGTALYTNVFQERQQYYVTKYAENVDRMNPEADVPFQQTLHGMQYMGKSETEALNMATLSTKGRIQVQATLSSIKEMSGWTFYGCLAAAAFVILFPYRKRKLSPEEMIPKQ